MGLDPSTREIDGHTYTYRPLGAKAGMRLFTQLVQRLGDSVGAAVTGAQRGDAAAAGAGALGALVTKLDPEFVESLIDTCAKRTTVAMAADSGATKQVPLDQVLDLHFARRLMAQLQWLEWCLEEQYTDFLGWLRTALSAVQTQADRKDG